MSRRTKTIKMNAPTVWQDPLLNAILSSNNRSLPHKSGKARVDIQFTELRVLNSRMEMDYIYHAGPCEMNGTLRIKAAEGEPLYEKIKELSTLCEEAFHQVRRAR